MSRWKAFRRESARRYRRANRLLAGILVAALVLGLSTVLYTDSYEKALETQRQQLYGAWHAAGYGISAETAAVWETHATVETVGHMTIAGQVLDGETILGGLGTVDAALIDLGRLTLLDGTWPTAPGEIAVETGCLTRLGRSYDLGQTLTLTISYEDGDGETCTAVQDFRLTGVLQDYAANWKREGATLASFVTAENPVPDAAMETHCFLGLRPQYLDSAWDLVRLGGQDGKYTVNDYTYLRYAPANQPAYDRLLLQLLVTGLSCLALVLLVTLDLRQRRETLVLLRGLGASRGQIARLYLGEKAPVLLRATAAGLVLGLGLPVLELAAAGAGLGRESPISLVPGHLLQFLGLYAGSVGLALLVGLIRLFQIPLRGKAQQQAEVPSIRRPRRLSRQKIHRVLASLHPSEHWAAFGLALISALVLLFTAYRAWDAWQSYRYNARNYPADYTYGFLQNRFSVRQPMDEDTLQAISQAYGVAEVRAFVLADPLPLTGSFSEDYIQAAGAFMSWDAGTVQGSLLGVSESALELYLEALDPSTREAVRSGTAVLLYVPDLVGEAETGWEPIGAESIGSQIVREDTAAAGDLLTLETSEGPVTLPVAGVVHDFSGLPFSLLPIRPYTLLCSESLCKSVTGTLDYGYVAVLGDPTAISYQTDLALSRISTGLGFTNYRVERQSWRQQLTLQLILSLVLGLSCWMLVGILRYGWESARAPRTARLRMLLWRLGADIRKLRRAEAVLQLRHTVSASLVAAFALLAWEAWEEAATLRSMANYADFQDQLLPMTLHNFTQNTHWLFLATLLGGYWLISLLRCSVAARHDAEGTGGTASTGGV